MKININGQIYEPLSCFAIPCYIYVENDECEDYWVDWQNAIEYFLDEESENNHQDSITKDGRKHWLISPVKPQGTIINEDNEDLVKWVVDTGPKEDLTKLWDFDNHCVVH